MDDEDYGEFTPNVNISVQEYDELRNIKANYDTIIKAKVDELFAKEKDIMSRVDKIEWYRNMNSYVFTLSYDKYDFPKYNGKDETIAELTKELTRYAKALNDRALSIKNDLFHRIVFLFTKKVVLDVEST